MDHAGVTTTGSGEGSQFSDKAGVHNRLYQVTDVTHTTIVVAGVIGGLQANVFLPQEKILSPRHVRTC